MKKIIFAFFITTVLSFTNGLRFMMEKDKIDNLNLKNSQLKGIYNYENIKNFIFFI